MRSVVTSEDVLAVPEGGEVQASPGAVVTAWAREIAETRGVRIVQAGTRQGRPVVDATNFGGAADSIGIAMGDIVTEMDIQILGQPNKALVYPFALLLLGLIILAQLPRLRRQRAAAEVPASNTNTAAS